MERAGMSPNETGNPNPGRERFPCQTRKNQLACAAGKQDDSGMHHATAANGKQDRFISGKDI
jgi:hypothetical protein